MTEVILYEWPAMPAMKFNDLWPIMAMCREEGIKVNCIIVPDYIKYSVEFKDDSEAIQFRLTYL